jgi:hypothetical protein
LDALHMKGQLNVAAITATVNASASSSASQGLQAAQKCDPFQAPKLFHTIVSMAPGLNNQRLRSTSNRASPG